MSEFMGETNFEILSFPHVLLLQWYKMVGVLFNMYSYEVMDEFSNNY